MLSEVHPTVVRKLSRTTRRQESALRATCLLCRVLWPIVVQHRHLQLDPPLEAVTLIEKPALRFFGSGH
jgi:hypothetical protein